MIVKALRVGLGQLIVLGDALTRPRPQQRSAQGQAAVDREAAALSLYADAGFERIKPYYASPVPGAVFLAKKLA